MNNATTFQQRFLPVIAVFLLTLISFRSAPAATHIVIFGGEVGFNYSPNVLQVEVGDVITWQGDFSMHPLHFEVVPDGATKPADVTSGSEFSYTVEVPGNYGYWCNFHRLTGMVGGFTTQSSRVDVISDEKAMNVSPNPVINDQKLSVQFTSSPSAIKKITICDMDGHCDQLLSPLYKIDGSTLTIDLDPMAYGVGAYTLSIVTDDVTYRRKIVIVR
jgi:plastocyanin